jgi:UDP-glucose 4-epimerase
MRIVVTGGAGFIASHVVDAYLKAGHEVLVVDDFSSGKEANVAPAAKVVRADIRSSEALKAVAAFKPETLNHHAAQIDVRRSVVDPALDAEVNVVGLLKILEAARSAGHLKRVIYAASGGSMHGDLGSIPTVETEPIGAVSPYGVSKAAGELYLFCFRAMHGLPYVALRYANVYGPRQNPHGEAGVVSIFCERLLAHKSCTIYGDGGQTRDFVYVGDVAAANVAALETSFSGGVNISTGVETDVNAVYRLVAQSVGSELPPIRAEARAGEQRRSVLSPAKAGQVLKWAPRVAIEQGLAQTVAWYRQQH